MSSKLAEPLVFQPIFAERVWGGRRLESLYGKRLPSAARVGESWEVVDRPEAQSVVNSGEFRGLTLHALWKQKREQVFGKVPESERFPILGKLLDAQENLSLQVHPPDAVAHELGGEPKSEFWYVVDALPKAEIFVGLKKSSTRGPFVKALKEGDVLSHAHRIEVKAGDVMFVPSGRLHAIGAGNLIVEIQQNSDTTYRVFDWNRTKDGRSQRTLHIAEALRCIDFSDREPALLDQANELLVREPSFQVEKWVLKEERAGVPLGQFAIIICLTGMLECSGLQFKPGDFFIVPAQLEDRLLKPGGENVSLLRVTIPTG